MSNETDETYEVSLEMQDMRLNEDIPAVPNFSVDYAEYMEWKHKVETNSTCRGRLYYYFLFLPWGVLASMEPFWQAGLIILVTAGVQYGSILRDGDLLRGLLLGSMSGAITTVILFAMWSCTFHMGAFVDTKSKLRYRNAYHKGTIFMYFFVVTLFITGAIFLAMVDKHCVPKNRVSCDVTCDITKIFTKGV